MQSFGAPLSTHWQVGADDDIGAQQLVGVAIKTTAQAVDEEASGGQGGYRYRQCDQQKAQLASTPVARRHIQSKF